MGIEECNRIKEICTKLKLHPEYLEHEAVRTSEEAANIRGMKLEQGIKALLFTNEQEFVIVNIPAHKKVNTKKVAQELDWQKNKMRMATQEEVMTKTGCQIGAVPPFGHKETIPLLIDNEVFTYKDNSYNIGLRTHSLNMKQADTKKIFENIPCTKGDFTKE